MKKQLTENSPKLDPEEPATAGPEQTKQVYTATENHVFNNRGVPCLVRAGQTVTLWSSGLLEVK